MARLSDDKWEEVQSLMPIACVDLLLWTRHAGAVKVLLIERVGPDSLTGWTLVGGRIELDETVEEAAARHLAQTLGAEVQIRGMDERFPDAVWQYFRGHRDGYGFDPRKHAVAATYVAEVLGRVEIGGEAIGHRLFALESLPSRRDFAFGQGELVHRLVHAVSRRAAAA
jgi:ADP-ribose pyrophosphatase YjhB (NUDIX family)